MYPQKERHDMKKHSPVESTLATEYYTQDSTANPNNRKRPRQQLRERPRSAPASFVSVHTSSLNRSRLVKTGGLRHQRRCDQGGGGDGVGWGVVGGVGERRQWSRWHTRQAGSTTVTGRQYDGKAECHLRRLSWAGTRQPKNAPRVRYYYNFIVWDRKVVIRGV